ncbi:MAG: PulJ/GspJ family protein [Planctomycetota bacterium]|jgi:prepilin-type N-terminal cleavage/methylation domain-containing protein
MSNSVNTFRQRRGFSLAEVLVSVVIGAMVLVTMITIYRQAETSAAAVSRRLDRYGLPFEILQRIAEDLDRIIASGSDTKITIENKLVKGYPAARLTILKTFKADEGRESEFERIVWQSAYDLESAGDSNGLVLFRSHSGLSLEDKLLDEKRADLEKMYPLVPICSGVTHFSIQVPKGEEELLDRWSGNTLPKGVVVTISFAEPLDTGMGTLEAPEEERITRTVAIDRTRKLRFAFVKKEPEEEETADEEEEEEADDEEAAAEGEEPPEEKEDETASPKPPDEEPDSEKKDDKRPSRQRR